MHFFEEKNDQTQDFKISWKGHTAAQKPSQKSLGLTGKLKIEKQILSIIALFELTLGGPLSKLINFFTWLSSFLKIRNTTTKFADLKYIADKAAVSKNVRYFLWYKKKYLKTVVSQTCWSWVISATFNCLKIFEPWCLFWDLFKNKHLYS